MKTLYYIIIAAICLTSCKKTRCYKCTATSVTSSGATQREYDMCDWTADEKQDYLTTMNANQHGSTQNRTIYTCK
jgi:hypothetical protein